jgi:acetate kinase
LRILVVNAGSSSLKLRLLGPGDELLGEHDLEAPQGAVDRGELTSIGDRFRAAVRVDDAVVDALRELTDLAPLHQPASLAALDAVTRALPGLPAIACFDTAFHATLPPAAATYALPAEWSERWGLRRYGFHGLSHSYASRRVAEMLGDLPNRMVTCPGSTRATLRPDWRSTSTSTACARALPAWPPRSAAWMRWSSRGA